MGQASRAEAAVEADVSVFGHDATGFEAVGDVDVLGCVDADPALRFTLRFATTHPDSSHPAHCLR